MDSITNNKNGLCIICEEKEAEFCIRGLPKDCYCKECAVESFGDIEVLERL
jgi:hypothetical protein